MKLRHTKEFLEESKSLFEGLSFNNARRLIEIVTLASYRKIDYIKACYQDIGINFSLTLDFLRDINLIRVTEDANLISLVPKDKNTPNFREIILNKLSKENSKYRNISRTFLENFSNSKKTFEYKPHPDNISSESHIRNFFIEAGLIKYSPASNCYSVPFDKIIHFINIRSKIGQVRPETLKKINIGRDILGLKAEKAVIQYENRRLGEPLCKRVLHSSLHDCSLGYDIQSLTIIKEKVIPRYIEVKAVSRNELRFFL